jgi:hypothetical protein
MSAPLHPAVLNSVARVRKRWKWLAVISAALLLVILIPQSARDSWTSGASSQTEGAAHGFPTLCDLNGKTLADGEFVQWIENDRLHVRIEFNFGGGHRTAENAVFEQDPQLIQESWSWQEIKDGKISRQFSVDFTSGKASAQKLDGAKLKHWERNVKITPGKTFAGFGFALAIKHFSTKLFAGQKIEFQTVGFTPKPHPATVEISFAGHDRLAMSGRTIAGNRFLIHPKIPWIARAFVKAPDTRIWLTTPPAVFLRSEQPLIEQDDPVVRIDLLPGEAKQSR